MSDDITQLNLIQLRRALQQAALPAELQIDRLKGFDAAFEIADDLHQFSKWAIQNANLTADQRVSLINLDEFTDRMSGESNFHLWTDDAIRSRPEWDEVRRQAQWILQLFEWPFEDVDDPGVQVVRPDSS